MKELIDKLFDSRGRLSSARILNLPNEVKEEIDKLTKNCTGSLPEKIFWIKNKLDDYPKKCYCGNSIKIFDCFSKGYTQQFCCLSCKSKSTEVKDKIKKTLFFNFGENVSNVGQLSSIKKQVKATLKVKYGTEKLCEVNKEKAAKTLMINYGVQHPAYSDEIKLRKIKKYKLNFISKVFNEAKKLQISPLFSKDEYSNLCGKSSSVVFNWKCEIHNREFYAAPETIFTFGSPCLICNPKSKNLLEDKIAIFLSELEIPFIQNSRKIITPYELDFYIPDYNIAIEVNGVYWHSTARIAEKIISKKYHFEKWKLCRDSGIQLFQIFEDEFSDTIFNKIKAILKNKLKLNTIKIHGRKCKIIKISAKEKETFLNTYHIQRNDRSSIYYGLVHNNELVGIMSFIKSRFNKNYEWEISRYCVKHEYSIVGGASKLLSHFEKSIKPKSLISYADLRFGTGEVYKHLGLNFLHFSSPNYWYVNTKTMTRTNRLGMQKHKLKELLGDKFDISLTENQNATKLNLYQIYDAGNAVYGKKY